MNKVNDATYEDGNIYKTFDDTIRSYENNDHYKNLMCLKDTGRASIRDVSKEKFMVDVNKMKDRDNLKKKCVLPVGHTGKCSHNYDNLFKKNDITKKLIGSISLSIYSSPGNDDYVYKNRCSRLYENVISSIE